MINFLLESTISLVAFLAFYYLFLEREKMHQFNRFYLLFSIVISFVIPFLSFEIIEIIPVVQNIEPVKTQTFSSVIKEKSIEESVIPLKETINYVPYILWSLYGLITIVLVARFGKNCFKLISKSKSNPIVKYKNAKLILINEKTLPHTFLNSIFVNFEDYNSRKIEDELYTHELVHVTQKHTLDILFIEFLKSIFWFNPIFYFYKKAIQLNHEFLADEKVVHSYNNVTFYQNLLLQKGSNVQTIYLASNLNYLVTKKRLIMMTKNTSKKLALVKKVAIVPIFAALVYFFCIDIVAQEKIVNVKPNLTEVSEKSEVKNQITPEVLNEKKTIEFEEEFKEKESKTKINSKKVIVIDAGHGGHDFGAKINDELESKIVESLAKKIKLLNLNTEIEIILLREDDSFIALKERTDKINELNPNLLISLHLNTSKNTSTNGVSAYVSSENEFYKTSLEAANKLIDKISNNNLAKGDVKDVNLFIIKNSKCPAILLEVGYLTNENDKTYITSEDGESEIANRILAFLKQY
jgi:N-acetylmuramoyl-L-alanine amidase